MRKVVITQFAMSLGGYICEEDTESCRPWRQMATDDELEEYLITRLPRASTHIMGPATYQNMAAHWPAPPGRSRRSCTTSSRSCSDRAGQDPARADAVPPGLLDGFLATTRLDLGL